MSVKDPRKWGAGEALMAAALVLAGVTVYVGTRPKANTLAASLLQAFTLLFTVYATVLVARPSDEMREADARTRVRPHAELAFRRMLNLYKALGRQGQVISQQLVRLETLREEADLTYVRFEFVRSSLLHLQDLVVEQVSTAEDAVHDWSDLLPDDVRELERDAEESSGS